MIKRVKLINYRNFLDFDIELSGGNLFILGENAAGKTNFLESIYYGIKSRSFRTHREREIINLRRNQAYIGLEFVDKGMHKRVEYLLDRNKKKRVKLNGKEVRSLRDIKEEVVVFSPDDLSLVKGAPENRRRFFDDLFSSIDSEYQYALNSYNRALLQKNNLLKEGTGDPNLLKVFDFELLKHGSAVLFMRNSFLVRMEEISRSILWELSGERENLKIVYCSDICFNNIDEDEIYEAFKCEFYKNKERDMIFKSTTTGPHRDDYIFYVEDKDSRSYSSQGQQRTLSLALLLAKTEFLTIKTGSKPILLLDDVFSELDEARRNYLIEYIRGFESFITGTERPEFVDNIILIENGNWRNL